MTLDPAKDLLSDSLKTVSRDARLLMLDDIYLAHNYGWTLEGNTAETDITWFARILWQRMNPSLPSWHFDDLISGDDRAHYLKLAEVTLESLPMLMGRISRRCVAMSMAVNTALRSERAAAKRKES